MKSTVAIIGSHPRTREEFDFNREDCDIWLFNEAISNPENRKWAKRADLIFQMHVPAIWRNPQNRNDPHHYEWLQKQDECDVMMQDVYEDVPRSKRYPLGDIAGLMGVTVDQLTQTAHFLTSSVPQAMALAALWGYQRVEVYGVAMETNTEYQFQREGVSFWIGYLMGHGVDVYFADTTFQAPLYGYEGKVSVEYEHFEKRIAELAPLAIELTKRYKAVELDAKLAAENFITESSKHNEEAMQMLILEQVKIGQQLGQIDGAIQENKRYKGKADTMKDAAEGEFVFSRQEFESAAKTHQDKSAQFHTQFVAAGTQLGNYQTAVRQSAKGSKKRAQLAEAFLQMISDYLKVNNAVWIYRGASNENMYYMQYLDKYVRAAGGSKSEEVLLGLQKAEAVNA